MLDDQLEPIYNSSVTIQNVASKTSWVWWTIETGGERGPGRPVLAAWYDDRRVYKSSPEDQPRKTEYLEVLLSFNILYIWKDCDITLHFCA